MLDLPPSAPVIRSEPLLSGSPTAAAVLSLPPTSAETRGDMHTECEELHIFMITVISFIEVTSLGFNTLEKSIYMYVKRAHLLLYT